MKNEKHYTIVRIRNLTDNGLYSIQHWDGNGLVSDYRNAQTFGTENAAVESINRRLQYHHNYQFDILEWVNGEVQCPYNRYAIARRPKRMQTNAPEYRRIGKGLSKFSWAVGYGALDTFGSEKAANAAMARLSEHGKTFYLQQTTYQNATESPRFVPVTYKMVERETVLVHRLEPTVTIQEAIYEASRYRSQNITTQGRPASIAVYDMNALKQPFPAKRYVDMEGVGKPTMFAKVQATNAVTASATREAIPDDKTVRIRLTRTVVQTSETDVRLGDLLRLGLTLDPKQLVWRDGDEPHTMHFQFMQDGG